MILSHIVCDDEPQTQAACNRSAFAIWLIGYDFLLDRNGSRQKMLVTILAIGGYPTGTPLVCRASMLYKWCISLYGDLLLRSPFTNLRVITGPNNSGKSTYLKQAGANYVSVDPRAPTSGMFARYYPRGTTASAKITRDASHL